jgi:hypothetical protein
VDCPACGKRNIESAAMECVRCGCDLADLQVTLRCATRRLSAAAKRARECDWPAALAEAEQSWRLRHSAGAARLAFAAAAAMGDSRRAILWHIHARQGE